MNSKILSEKIIQFLKKLVKMEILLVFNFKVVHNKFFDRSLTKNSKWRIGNLLLKNIIKTDVSSDVLFFSFWKT